MPLTSYYKEIHKINTSNPNAKEHSYRTPLQNLWNTQYGKDFPILHEGSSEKGTPDFTISNKQGHTIGFIECKDFGFDLMGAVDGKKQFHREHAQLIKYLTLAPVVIFTNYTHFLLVQQTEEGLNILAEANTPAELEPLFTKFLQAKPLPVKNQDTFIKVLAQKTRILRDDILTECQDPNSYFSQSDIHKLFSETIYKELDVKDFADSFAQIVAFGLLFTRLSDKNPVDIQTFHKIPQFIPLFKELLSKFNFEDARGIRYILDSIIETINLYDESMFYKGKNYKDSHDLEDPFIYMYENFLKEFDANTRNARGVFYTPIEVVGYIIRSIDELLKMRLGLGQGLRHKDVHILDFATGTGTFLLGAIEHIYRDLENSGSSGLWKSQVKDFILQNLYGFEYLVVPYILAHFRIHQYLEDCNYSYEKNDRLKLYLTNTLDNSSSASIPMFPELNRESADAYRIKNEEPILVIMGNPPYNSSSDPMNSRKWITDLTSLYKRDLSATEAGKLTYDEIKFIRFAHWKMQQAEKGIVAMIVNNAFISGISHRTMREELLNTFDEIYIYDLHGNINKAEKCPDGSADHNIFNIAAAGVCIVFFIKTGLKNNPNTGIYHQEIFGTQPDKKKALVPCSWDNDTKDKKWQKLADDAKWHWFVPMNANARYWDEFMGLHEIFDNINSGIQTERDHLVLHYEQESLNNLLANFKKMDTNALRDFYKEKDDGRDWHLDWARQSVVDDKGTIQQVHYRPFDFRWTYYTPKSKEFLAYPRYETMQHFVGHDNMGLVFTRQCVSNTWQHAFISNSIAERCLASLTTREVSYIAPLYIYGNKQEGTLGLEEAQKPNWTASFTKFLTTYHTTQPEAVLAYIYAVLYAPSYRATYAEDLSYDYPRIPFTTDKAKFDVLADLGQKIIDLHLLKTAPSVRAGYPTDGDHRVDEVRWVEDKLFINSTQAFTNVPAEVWNYQIGGYQVLDKWLKSRKARNLTLDEINHFQQVCGIIADTISLQQQIDVVSGVW